MVSDTEEYEEVEKVKVENAEVEVETETKVEEKKKVKKEEAGETDEVAIIKEVSRKEPEVGEVVKRRKEKKSASGDSDPWGSTDRLIKEVKAGV